MRCCVCGWVDADQEHEIGHLKSQYRYLANERARLRAELDAIRVPRGGNIVTDAILKLGRGLVRPVGLLLIIGGVVTLALYHGLTVDALEGAALLAAFGGPIVGWWFKERAERHDVQDVLREDAP